jgi:hypothetical protein
MRHDRARAAEHVVRTKICLGGKAKTRTRHTGTVEAIGGGTRYKMCNVMEEPRKAGPEEI